LDIFASRAQSAEGKLQVELAQLKYNLPRLVGSGGVMAKMKNSVGTRGPGEKKLELDKRKIRDEIFALEKQIAKLRDQRELSRHLGTQSGKPRVCLVGYTNSGKSTLLNTIAKAQTYARDQLFATLDPKTVKVFLNPELQILLTDTVGFIDKLPHEFINAFESTLDSVRYANLLLHIVDLSNPKWAEQIAVVNSVLKNIGADKIPTIIVYNKIDRVDGNGTKPTDGVCISAAKNVNIDLLKNEIAHIMSI
jgi:GTP-binding protein HflX